jgi:hypothetical protein
MYCIVLQDQRLFVFVAGFGFGLILWESIGMIFDVIMVMVFGEGCISIDFKIHGGDM